MKNVNQLSFAHFAASASKALSLVIATGAVLGGVSQTAIAQVTNADPLFQNSQSGDNNSDPFSGRGSGQMNSVFDLIHQITLGGGQNASEFQQEQREVINSEAEDFRTRQLELLQQENLAAPPATPEQN